MEVGEAIRKARKKKGFTLRELGIQLSLSHAALSKIENGRTEASRRTLIDLARVLNDTFGLDWLETYLVPMDRSLTSKKEIIDGMTAREFISLKFGGKQSRRSKAEAEMLAKLLDAEIERMKNEGW